MSLASDRSARIEADPEPVYTGVERRRAPRSGFSRAQWRLPWLRLPPPEAVPSRATVQERLAADREGALSGRLARELGRAEPDGRHVVAAIERALPVVAPRPFADIGFMVATGQPADVATHDCFFRIRRSATDDPLDFLAGQFRALQLLRRDLAETPTSLGAEDIGHLVEGILHTVAFASGLRREPAGAAFRRPRRPRAAAEAPIRRWIRGHQIFAALTQGLVLAMDEIERADRADDGASLAAAADLAAVLLRSSAASLRLTGDVDGDFYRDVIRTAMCTPFLPSGFSGLLSADHRHLVMRMKAVRPSIERLAAVGPERHARIVAELVGVYDSHKCVCDQFVGREEASLLMAAGSIRSAVEQIDRFKVMRLRSLGCPASGSRS